MLSQIIELNHFMPEICLHNCRAMKHTDLQANKDTQFTTMVLGITLAIAGGHHGFFEILQGNIPTASFLIQSIGPEQQFWIHGSDEAITIIPNFLTTGILALLTSISIVVVCLFYLKYRKVSRVLLILFILLTLFGGGIGHIPFFLMVWAFSRYQTGDLPLWGASLKGRFSKIFSKCWPYLLFISSISFLIGLEISIFGFVPGLTDPDRILMVCWAFLAVSLFFMPLTYVAAIIRDFQT